MAASQGRCILAAGLALISLVSWFAYSGMFGLGRGRMTRLSSFMGSASVPETQPSSYLLPETNSSSPAAASPPQYFDTRPSKEASKPHRWAQTYYEDLEQTNFPRQSVNPQRMSFCSPGGAFHDMKDCKDYSCLECLQDLSKRISNDLKGNHKKKMQARRKFLSKQLEQMRASRGDTISLVIVDNSFANFSLNWACSLERHGMRQQVAKTLWVSTTNVTYAFFQRVLSTTAAESKQGFGALLDAQTHYGLFPDEKDPWKTKVYREAAKALLVVVMQDLLQLGYHVIFNDADVAWLKNPIPWLLGETVASTANGQFSHPSINMDIQLMAAPNRLYPDMMGPGNSGFIFLRNSLKSRVFIDTFVEGLHLLFMVDDQKAWNAMIQHPLFRALHFHVLPRRLFLDLHLGTAPWQSNNTFIVHAVGTGKKKSRMTELGHWYFDQSCSLYTRALPHFYSNFPADKDV